MSDKEKIYGYYDKADQPIDQPTYNPAFDSPCLFCGEKITENDMRTHSMMLVGKMSRSYFYRTHATCHEKASDRQRFEIDDIVFENIKHNGD